MDCQVCGAKCDDAIHRRYDCPGLENWDGVGEHAMIRQRVREERRHCPTPEQRLWHELGVLQAPAMPPPSLNCSKAVFGGTGNLADNIFVDGSGLNPRYPEIRRCGWAYVCMQNAGETGRFAYGPLPGYIQTVPHAEAYALLTLLKGLREQSASTRSSTVVDIVSDCKSVVDTYNGCIADACAAGRALGEVWREIADTKTQLRRWGQVAPVRWVPAHQSPEQARAGKITETDRAGNEAADELAKAGASLHGLSAGNAATYLGALENARAHIDFMVRAHGYVCGSQAWHYEDDAMKPAASPKQPQLEVVAHVLKELPEGGFMCTICRARVVKQGKDALLAAKCVPYATKLHDSHVAYKSGDIIWCSKCGNYAEAQTKGLTQPCGPASAWGLKCVRHFKNGVHPVASKRGGEPLMPPIRM